MMIPDDILQFWFEGASESPAVARERNQFWFGADRSVDEQIWELYADSVNDAAAGHYDDWADTAHGRLALIILLDQFPRNIYRGTAEVYRHDAAALALACEGVLRGQLAGLSVPEQAFFLMPYQHSEDLAVQEAGVRLYTALADGAEDLWRPLAAGYRDFAMAHHAIIAVHGRFPHRNRVLGRNPTAEENIYLASGGASFGQAG